MFCDLMMSASDLFEYFYHCRSKDRRSRVDRNFKKITLVSKKMDRTASNWSRKVHEVIFCWFRYDSIERSLLRGRFDEKRSLRICGTTNKVHEVRRGGGSSFDSQRHFREKHDFRLGKTRTAIPCFLSEKSPEYIQTPSKSTKNLFILQTSLGLIIMNLRDN